MVLKTSEQGRAICSVQIDLPAEIDAEICRYTEEDQPTSKTVTIHSALYAYRRQCWTREQLRQEAIEAIERGLRSSEEGKGTLVTPQFWKKLWASCDKQQEEIKALRQAGKIGNLLLPEELYAFVSERINSGDCQTPTDVICAAMPYFRKEHEEKQ
jgi:hypothetical protein